MSGVSEPSRLDQTYYRALSHIGSRLCEILLSVVVGEKAAVSRSRSKTSNFLFSGYCPRFKCRHGSGYQARF